MDLINHNGQPHLEAARSETSLYACVGRLAGCLAESVSPDAATKAGRCEEWGNAAQSALAAAQAADRLIAEQMQRLAHFEHLAVTDELTGLLNRRGFQAEIKRTMLSARRYKEKGVLIFVDLDGFKPINDTHGHAAGDEVLRTVAGLLSENVRATDAVGRLGGDEFAILLARSSWEDGLKRAEAFDEMINGAVADWEGETIPIRASLGFQTYGPNDDMEKILQSADDAMYATKRARAGAEPQPRLSHASA